MDKILVIEDNDIYFEKINSEIGGKAEIYRAISLEEAENVFFGNNNNYFRLVIVTACLKSEFPNTTYLINKIKKSGYNNIIGTSFSSMFRKKMSQAGAAATTTKTKAPDIIKDQLKLNNP